MILCRLDIIVAVFIAIFSLLLLPINNNPNELFIDDEVKLWLSGGKFFNHKGHAIFYKDSAFDTSITNSSENLNLPILILLHGFPTFSFDYHHMYYELLQKYRIIAPDFLGFGLSDKPVLDYSIVAQSDIIESIISEVLKNIDGVNLQIVTHDYGVSVGQELISRQLERHKNNITCSYTITSLVFLNGGLFPETHRATITQKLLLSKYTGFIVTRLMSYSSFASSFSIVFGPNTQLSEREMKIYWNAITYKDGNAIMHKLQQYIICRRLHRDRWVNGMIEAVTPSTSHNTIRILLLNGPFDPISGWHVVQRYGELIPASEWSTVMVLDDAIGHYPHLEDTLKVEEIISKFLL